MMNMTVLEWLGLALYRLIFLLGLFNFLMGILGFFNPGLMQAVYRKLFRLDVSGVKPALDDEDAKPRLSAAELKALDALVPAPRMPLRVYVAASSREMERVDRALAMLGGLTEVVVTYRWIDDMRAEMAKGRSDKDLSRDEAMEAGHKCLLGVAQAEVVWLLYPNEPTRGAWVELGYARALFDHDGTGAIQIVVSYENRTSLGACPLAVSDDFHETLGDAEGLKIIEALRDAKCPPLPRQPENESW